MVDFPRHLKLLVKNVDGRLEVTNEKDERISEKSD
jgi:hypothetical protein